MVRLVSVTLLGVSVLSIHAALSNTPAFNPKLRAETVVGDWRVALNDALYDRGRYAYQRGYGYLAAEGLISAETEARDEVATVEVAADRAEKALSALQDAVRYDPGNAYTWASLGWAHARLGDDQAALEKLRKSWRLAPNNRVLADTRLNLIGTLTTPDLMIVEMTAADREAVLRDIAALELWDTGALKFNLELHSQLADM